MPAPCTDIPGDCPFFDEPHQKHGLFSFYTTPVASSIFIITFVI